MMGGNMTNGRRRPVRAIAVVLLVLTSGACGASTDSATRADADRDLLHSVFDDGPYTYWRAYDRLADFLPNVRHTSAQQPSQSERPTDSVVLAVVTESEEGAGFIESGTPPTSGQPGARATSYSDPVAHWRTLRVTLAVKEVLAGPATNAITIDLPLKGNARDGDDGVAVERALRELGTVVVLSKELPDRPEYLGMRRVLPDAPFGIATVDDQGALAFPFIAEGVGPNAAEEFMAGLDTLEELRAQARQPDRTVRGK